MSGTPRTDEEVLRWDGTEIGYSDAVPADFARQLEAELVALQAKRIACPYCNPIMSAPSTGVSTTKGIK